MNRQDQTKHRASFAGYAKGVITTQQSRVVHLSTDGQTQAPLLGSLLSCYCCCCRQTAAMLAWTAILAAIS